MKSNQTVYIEGKILCTDYSFNELFSDEHYMMMKRVNHIVLGHAFNQIFDIPPHILSIRFSNAYKKPIVLTPNLVSLAFGNHYRECLELGPCVKRLIVGSTEMPYFGLSNNQVILNKYLVYLNFLGNTHLNFISSKYLEELIVTFHSMQIILNYHVKKVVLCETFDFIIDLTKKVKILRTGEKFNQILKLNKNMRTVKFGRCFAHRICFPKHLENIYFSSSYSYPIILPPHLKILHANDNTCDNFLIEHSNIEMRLWMPGNYHSKKIPNSIESLPNGFKCVSTILGGEKMLNLPTTAHVVRTNVNVWNCLMCQTFHC